MSRAKRRFLTKATQNVDNVCYSSNIYKLCKFNFHYFQFNDEQSFSFDGKNYAVLEDFITKLKSFSSQSIEEWIRDDNYKEYGGFPEHSKLKLPKSIPSDVLWGRFRLSGIVRLAGFRVPGNIHNEGIDRSDHFFDKNTFYVVFLDLNHDFYPVKPR